MARRKKPEIVEETFACPHCGADVKLSAHFCRACGSSEADGWAEEEYQPDDEFDYDEYIRRETGAKGPLTWRRGGAVVIILLCCLVILLLQLVWG